MWDWTVDEQGRPLFDYRAHGYAPGTFMCARCSVAGAGPRCWCCDSTAHTTPYTRGVPNAHVHSGTRTLSSVGAHDAAHHCLPWQQCTCTV